MSRAVPLPSTAPAIPLDLSRLVGAAGWARLPAAVRRRFSAGHADVSYAGQMTLQCSRAGRVFAWLSAVFRSPLASGHGESLPTRVDVRCDGGGGVVWERQMGDAQVRSIKTLGPDGRLVELTEGGLGMELEVFEEDGTLVFQSRRYFLHLGGWWRLPVPALLGPGTCRVVHTDLGQGFFRFTLSMTHRWWGLTFHHSGVFRDPTPSTHR
jgi:hypothetical protein